jgi:hypothetical protein
LKSKSYICEGTIKGLSDTIQNTAIGEHMTMVGTQADEAYTQPVAIKPLQ